MKNNTLLDKYDLIFTEKEQNIIENKRKSDFSVERDKKIISNGFEWKRKRMQNELFLGEKMRKYEESLLLNRHLMEEQQIADISDEIIKIRKELFGDEEI